MAEIVFWICAGLVLYIYVGYPLLVWGLAGTFGSKPTATFDGMEALPRISLLVSAHNEQAFIGRRIENALALDYPSERLEIVVASDGSSDSTADIVRRYAGQGVRLLNYTERRGKASVLNSAMSELTGDIVLLSDANTFQEPQAARKLARWFTDPSVGAVCGRLILVDRATGQNVDSMYWKYETFLKMREGRLGALLGANGAIYAVRRLEYVPIPADTIIDDFVIPLLARLNNGRRIVYDNEAIATEETPLRISAEFRRRSRIGAGGFQSIIMLWRLLSPRYGWLSFSFLSHKVLRWLCPFFLIGLLLANLALWDSSFYKIALAIQLSFYALSVVGACLPGASLGLRLIRMTTMFTSMNLALFVGFWEWLLRRQRGIWTRTAR